MSGKFFFLLVFVLPSLWAQSPADKREFNPVGLLNQALPEWLRFSGEERLRLEGFSGGGFRPSNQDAYLLQRFRLNADLTPAAWLKFHAQAQDARVWWKTQKPYVPPFQNTWDLREAFVELGSTTKGLFGLRVGRQEMTYGEERMVGSSYWGNSGRSFDAVRLTLRRGWHKGSVRADIFAASVVGLTDGHIGESHAGDNFHGINGGVDNVISGVNIEPFVYWRLAPRLRTEAGLLGNLDTKTFGIRWAGKAHGLSYNVRIAGQRGTLGVDEVRAWAGYILANYSFARVRWQPKAIAEFNYASGDANPRDGIRQSFDPLYPSVHDKSGLADQIGIRNIRHFRGGADFKPAPKWSVGTKHNLFWLANAHDALYGTNNSVVALRSDGSAGVFVGQELDATTGYAFSKTFQLGAGVGHLFPGEFLKKTTQGKAFTYPYLVMTWAF